MREANPSLTRDGNTIIYTYDANGIRTEKNNNGIVTKYFYDESNNLISLVQGDTQLVFYYDADGQADSFVVYSGDTETCYYYVKNLQGDVTKIMSADGTVVANYCYDAYGEILSITDVDGETITDTTSVAFINPLRYRSYVYDNDTGLYYLQSRYYDPDVCRFINADVYIDTGTGVLGTNMYAYCENNPVNGIDKTGYVVTPANVIGAVIGGIIGAVGGYFLSRFLADKLKLKGWKRNAFIVGITAVITAAAAVIGYFIGPYIAKLGKAAVNSLKRSLIESACFVSGTQVLTDNGHVSIENIRPGDMVWSENLETGEKNLKSVERVFVRETNTIVTVSTEKNSIDATEDHPFWVEGKGWLSAKNLSIGNMLRIQNGLTEEVVDITIRRLNESIKVYNFEVEDWHTYYVSNSGILVHNSCAVNFMRKSASQIEKMLGAKSGTFHRIIKPDILKSVGKSALKKVGSNPDILIAKDGTIQLVSTVKKGVGIITKLNIFDFIP